MRLYERIPKSEMDERVSGALKRAALWDEVKDKLHQSGLGLSGGQRQRTCCIARTIAVKPSVILLDEPASALDPISTAKIEELIYQLKSDYTIVIVTHNMQQAARVSDFYRPSYLGELHRVRRKRTKQVFTAAHGKPYRGLHHRPASEVTGHPRWRCAALWGARAWTDIMGALSLPT